MSDRNMYRNDRGDYGRGGYRDNRRNSGGGYRRDFDNRRNSGGDREYHQRGGRGGRGRPQHLQQQQQHKQRYQSSFVGQKRGRDEGEAVDPKKQFIKRLMRLGEPGPLSEGDKTNAGDSAENTIDNALWAFKQEIRHQTPQLIDTVLEAVVSCSHKTLHYALLLGLLNSEDPDWVASFVAAAGQHFERELQTGEVFGPRLLMRLFACLTHASVLHANDVLGLMARTVDVAMSQVSAGRDPSGLTWQSWSDQLVYLVLGGLVWGGPQLRAAAAEEHESIMQTIEQYMHNRPIQESVQLRPMYGADDADDAAAASDSGGASFLGQLWHAVQVLRHELHTHQQQQQPEDHDPHDPDAPQHHEVEQQQQQVEIQGIPMELLAAFKSKLTGHAVELPPISLPETVPGVATDIEQLGPVGRAEVAVKLQDRYPARGGMRILEPQYTDGTRGPLDRFVAEEMIIDLLVAFDAYRVELSQMLCSSLPLPYDYSGLLCETLFAQLLRLPSPRLSPVAFSALIAHTALLRPAFPRYLAGSVRQLYLRLQFLAPELTGRLADVLAHFISNMSFRWPWDKYRMGLSQPPGGPQRTFLVAVLHDLVKLTSWDHQLLLQETPPDFLALLGEQPTFTGLPVPVPYPPAPAPPPLPSAAAVPEQQQTSPGPDGQEVAENQQDEQQAAADADQQMADADAQHDAADGGVIEPAAGDNAGAADEMQQDEQQQQQQQEEQAAAPHQHDQPNGADAVMNEAAGEVRREEQDPEQLWAGKLLGVMQSRPPPERKPLTYEQVLEWIDSQQMAQQLNSPEAHFRAVVRAVLAAGSKSCSHCYVLIERYSPCLFRLMQQLDQQQQQQEQADDDERKTAQEMLLELLWDMYNRMPRRLNLAVARLHEVSLLSPATTVKWLTAHPGLQFGPAADEAAAADCWQLLDDIIAGAISRYQGALEHKLRLEDAVAKARAKLTAASEESAAAAEAQQAAEGEGGDAGGDAGAVSGGGTAGKKRQAISWPGSAGRHGAAHRVEVAALREELMAKRLAAAEELFNQQDQQISRLEAVRGETLLLAFKGLTPRLLDALVAVAERAAHAAADAGLEGQDDDMAAEGAEGQQETPQERQDRLRAEAAAAAESARRLCLAQMEGFSRCHRSQVVELGLTEQLLQHVDSLVLGDDVRAAVLGPLHLC